MNIISRIKKNKIRNPLQQNFSAIDWNEIFEKEEALTGREKNLQQFGIWTKQLKDTIDHDIGELNINEIPKHIWFDILIGLVNRNSQILRDRTTEYLSKSEKDWDTRGISQTKTTIPETGDEVYPTDIIEQGVDAVKYPLIMVNSLKNGEKKASDKTFYKYSYLFMNLGIVYSMMESLWKSAIWEDYRILKKDNINVIFPNNSKLATNKALSIFRREQLALSMSVMTYSFWSRIPSQIKEKSCPVLITKKKGKKKSYTLKYDIPDSPPMSFVHELIARETYLVDFISEPLPNLQNITINQLIETKSILTSLSQSMIDKFPKNNAIFKLATLKQFTCAIELKEIAKILQSALKIKLKLARYILDIFTFSWKTREDLWLKPIIKTETKTLLLIEPLLSGNLLRDIEYWIKIGGLDMAKRGTEFEKASRRLIKESINNNNIVHNASVIDGDMTIHSGKSYEEIDIVIFIRNKVIICEAKCNIHPVEPSDYKHYFNDLQEASDQATRKIKFIKKDIPNFFKQIGSEYKIIEDPIFIPLVLTNSQLGVGLAFDGVPVVDSIILSKYFSDGSYEINVPFDGKINRDLGKKVNFYTNEEEAYQNIETYLKSPPQLKEATENVAINMRTIPYGHNRSVTKFATHEVRIEDIDNPLV